MCIYALLFVCEFVIHHRGFSREHPWAVGLALRKSSRRGWSAARASSKEKWGKKCLYFAPGLLILLNIHLECHCRCSSGDILMVFIAGNYNLNRYWICIAWGASGKEQARGDCGIYQGEFHVGSGMWLKSWWLWKSQRMMLWFGTGSKWYWG